MAKFYVSNIDAIMLPKDKSYQAVMKTDDGSIVMMHFENDYTKMASFKKDHEGNPFIDEDPLYFGYKEIEMQTYTMLLYRAELNMFGIPFE